MVNRKSQIRVAFSWIFYMYKLGDDSTLHRSRVKNISYNQRWENSLFTHFDDISNLCISYLFVVFISAPSDFQRYLGICINVELVQDYYPHFIASVVAMSCGKRPGVPERPRRAKVPCLSSSDIFESRWKELVSSCRTKIVRSVRIQRWKRGRIVNKRNTSLARFAQVLYQEA